jgi:hypothetical protein
VNQSKPHNKQLRQFTREDCARIVASTVNTVLEKLAIRQTATGIAVFPAGEGVFLVDVVMRDLSAEDTWAVSLTIPPPQEALMIGWEKQFSIATINRADLTELGFSDEQIATQFSDEVMQEIAATMEESYYMNFGFWEDFRRAITIVLTANSLSHQDVQASGKEQEDYGTLDRGD